MFLETRATVILAVRLGVIEPRDQGAVILAVRRFSFFPYMVTREQVKNKSSFAKKAAGRAMKQPELPLITKTYDLALWACHHTGRFPRQHRFVLGEKIERRL